MKKNIIRDKSFAFALRVVNLAKYLEGEKREYVLSKQVLRSGTAIGALVREAEHTESKANFIHKMNIALKEANETLYWLELLHHGEYIDKQSFQSIGVDSEELIKLLIAIVKTSKVSKRSDNYPFSIIHYPFLLMAKSLRSFLDDMRRSYPRVTIMSFNAMSMG